jgi:hypothetical protein
MLGIVRIGARRADDPAITPHITTVTAFTMASKTRPLEGTVPS